MTGRMHNLRCQHCWPRTNESAFQTTETAIVSYTPGSEYEEEEDSDGDEWEDSGNDNDNFRKGKTSASDDEPTKTGAGGQQLKGDIREMVQTEIAGVKDFLKTEIAEIKDSLLPPSIGGAGGCSKRRAKAPSIGGAGGRSKRRAKDSLEDSLLPKQGGGRAEREGGAEGCSGTVRLSKTDKSKLDCIATNEDALEGKIDGRKSSYVLKNMGFKARGVLKREGEDVSDSSSSDDAEDSDDEDVSDDELKIPEAPGFTLRMPLGNAHGKKCKSAARSCQMHQGLMKMKDGKKVRWALRGHVHVFKRSVPGNYKDGYKIFSDVLLSVLNQGKANGDADVNQVLKLQLPERPTEDLFSRIKGKTFKLTIVNKGYYGPEIVAMKLFKR